ncbi:hypothetical protein HK405_008027, partial [Cladochytrium tenue]
MTLTGDETTCIATPNFGGFVPSLKYQFALTYGNATRHILRTDPSLKQGHIQQELARRREGRQKAERASVTIAAVPSPSQSAGSPSPSTDTIWKKSNKYATGDDRFSFPPVPGYTGYIPRSEEHFGRPYVETTNASLADFEHMRRSRDVLPTRVQAVVDQGRANRARGQPLPKQATSGTAKPTFAYSAHFGAIDERSPYRRPRDDPEKTFISGYTGFVPRLQNHFGEAYSESVRKAIEDFTAPAPSRDPYKDAPVDPPSRGTCNTRPIPGFTGFVPGSKYGYATTFGKSTEIAYENFNKKLVGGKSVATEADQLSPKQLSKTRPIPGYRGHKKEASFFVAHLSCVAQVATIPLVRAAARDGDEGNLDAELEKDLKKVGRHGNGAMSVPPLDTPQQQLGAGGMRHNPHVQSAAREYANACSEKPRDYWDYDNVNIVWG